MALSMRLPTIVTRSRASASPSGMRLSGARRRSTPRSPASATFATRSAASSGTPIAASTASVSCWATVSSAVANSSASSARPSSISEITVCSWLAASWAWALRESANPRTVSSSLTSARSSVWSRRVTTVPSRRPSQRACCWLTTTMRSRGEVDLVGPHFAGGERLAERHGQPQLVDGHADGLVGQVEQPPGLVVDELHAPLAVEQHQPLADGVQHGVVVLVAPGELGGPEVVGGAPQPAAHEERAGLRPARAPPRPPPAR